MLFKFWRWRLEVKLRSLDDDEKIIYLSQEIIKAVAKSGKKMETVDGLASLNINVFQHADENKGEIKHGINNWALPLGNITCIKWKSDKKSSPASDDRQES